MAIDERTRHHLFLRLEEVLGDEDANTLMEHLPPVGWAEVATKSDLTDLERRVDLRFELSEERLTRAIHEMASSLRSEMNTQSRLLFLGNVGLMITLASLLLART
ncbi:MAG: hypothetical protein QOG82_1990 [Actinomycetota bacterium]|jgi:hypothetical protein|nr:hypothetical protein [Actinomycetota bacterium]